jgi:hypothetical protein
LCTTSTRQQAETDFTQAELGVSSGHTDVAGEDLLQTAAVRVAVDGRNDGFVEIEQHGEGRVPWLLGGPLHEVCLDIAAGTEGALSAAGQNADAQARIVTKLLPDVGQPFIGLEVTDIQSFRAVDSDVRDGSSSRKVLSSTTPLVFR